MNQNKGTLDDEEELGLTGEEEEYFQVEEGDEKGEEEGEDCVWEDDLPCQHLYFLPDETGTVAGTWWWR
jgi:hypothetical protein